MELANFLYFLSVNREKELDDKSVCTIFSNIQSFSNTEEKNIMEFVAKLNK